MILILAVIALASVNADPLKLALQSSESLVTLFTQFEAAEGRVYDSNEVQYRIKLFKKSVESVVETNEQDLGWEAELNFFADQTEAEKQQYLGLNVSLAYNKGEPLPLSNNPLQSSIDWRPAGGVTGVKNQGPCGACWSFGAVGSLEGVHKAKSGVLVSFAEQELLECVYEGRRDGCEGGWMQDAFDYMIRNQRLAPASAVRYRAFDGACNYGAIANGLRTKVEGKYEVSASENGHMRALARGPIAVAFEVTNDSYQYRRGTFKDTSCHGNANHAVTMVGYNSQEYFIKNSWGRGWGSGGYIYMARHHHNCRLYSHSVIISLGGPENGVDDVIDPSCEDLSNLCTVDVYTEYLCEHQPHNCMKTCGRC